MNKTPKISVIVPVINAHKTLDLCLKSIILQTYKNLEIICVNGDSNDNSSKIIIKYLKHDSRIKTVACPTQNIKTLRNIGLEICSGDYVYFIDTDCILSLSLYKIFSKTIQGLDEYPDLFLFNAKSYSERKNLTSPENFFTFDDWTNHISKNYLHTFDDCRSPLTDNMSPVNKLYKTSVLKENNLIFDNSFLFEDACFNIAAFLCAESIIVNPETLCQKLYADDRSRFGKKVYDIFKVTDKLQALLETKNVYDKYKYAFFRYQYNTYKKIFEKTDLLYKPRFFKEMKKHLNKTKGHTLENDVCTKLEDYELYCKIKESNWLGFCIDLKIKP